jgi:hypothetical protein
MRDLKEPVGVLMRVLGGSEIAEADVLDLAFEADGELQVALNEAYIKLLEFVHDYDLRRADHKLDLQQRAALQDALNRIVALCDVTVPHPAGQASMGQSLYCGDGRLPG